MVVIEPDGGGGATDGGEATAAYTPLNSEPTLHAFSPDRIEDAQRITYRADESGVIYSLTVLAEALKEDNLPNLGVVAGIWANRWNINAAVPGVTEIEDGQEVTTLGSINDIVSVAVESTSGNSTTIVTVKERDMEPQFFAPIIKQTRSLLDALEAPG